MKSKWDHWDDIDPDEEDSSDIRRREEKENEETARMGRKKKYMENQEKKKFYVGEKVLVKEDFVSNSNPKRGIKAGTYLYVIKKDIEGDLCVNDGTWDTNCWVLKKQFPKIEWMENLKLKGGDIIKIVEPFYTASKSPIYLEKGCILTVTRRDKHGDYSVQNGVWEKNQWLLRRHTYNVEVLENPIEVGDMVKILEEFRGSSKNGIEFQPGNVVFVKKIDEAGDLSVNNGTWEKNQWITKKHFNKVAKLCALDIVDVEDLEPIATTIGNETTEGVESEDGGAGKKTKKDNHLASYGGVQQAEKPKATNTSGDVNLLLKRNITTPSGSVHVPDREPVEPSAYIPKHQKKSTEIETKRTPEKEEDFFEDQNCTNITGEN